MPVPESYIPSSNRCDGRPALLLILYLSRPRLIVSQVLRQLPKSGHLLRGPEQNGALPCASPRGLGTDREHRPRFDYSTVPHQPAFDMLHPLICVQGI